MGECSGRRQRVLLGRFLGGWGRAQRFHTALVGGVFHQHTVGRHVGVPVTPVTDNDRDCTLKEQTDCTHRGQGGHRQCVCRGRGSGQEGVHTRTELVGGVFHQHAVGRHDLGREYSFPELSVLTLIRCLLHPRVTALSRKRPRSFCLKCRWQVTPKHAYTLDQTKSEWTDSAAVQAFHFHFIISLIPCGKFESPFLGKATAAARAALPVPNSACGIFVSPNKGMASSAWDLSRAHGC